MTLLATASAYVTGYSLPKMTLAYSIVNSLTRCLHAQTLYAEASVNSTRRPMGPIVASIILQLNPVICMI